MLQSLSTLDELDFLPEAYRQRKHHRHAQVWGVGLYGLFAAAFAVTSWLQHGHFREVEAKLRAVQSEHASALEHNRRAAEVHADLHQARSAAALHTHLRGHWPRTQVLAAAIQGLPDSVTLSECHVGREVLPLPPQPQAPAEAKEAPADHAARRARDLSRLQREHQAVRCYVQLQGHALEAAELHEYLARLGGHPLVVKVDLHSIENTRGNNASDRRGNRYQFTARAILRYAPSLTPGANEPRSTTSIAPLALREGRE